MPLAAKHFSNLTFALAMLKNYNPYGAPGTFRLIDLLQEDGQVLGTDAEPAPEIRHGGPGTHV